MNKVILIGNVGKDPQVKYFEKDVCVAQLNLATTERGYTLPNGTQVPERTEWHTCIFWRKQAEVVEKFVHKGDKLYVEGKIQSREWTDKQGKSRRVTEIMVDNLELLSPRSASMAEGSTVQSVTPQPTAQQSVPQQPSAQVVTPAQNDDQYPF